MKYSYQLLITSLIGLLVAISIILTSIDVYEVGLFKSFINAKWYIGISFITLLIILCVLLNELLNWMKNI